MVEESKGIVKFLCDEILAIVNKLKSDISTKQDTLVSGTNIKTVNDQSLLGTGNVTIDVPNIAQDLATPSANAVPSTQAVADESSRITSIMDTKVSKSGDTITGRLAISNGDVANFTESDTTYFIRRSNEDNTEDLTETHIDAFRVYDKNNKIMSDFRSQRTSTSQSTQMIARKNKSDGSTVQADITVSIINGIPISTINQDTQHNGTLTSVKDSYNFIAKSPSIEKGVTPTNDKFVGYDWRDKNGNRLAWLGVSYGTNGTKTLQLQKLDTNLTNFIIGYPTYAVTPSSTSNDTQVATTNWAGGLARVNSWTNTNSFNSNVYRISSANDSRFISKNSNLSRGTAPTSNVYGGYRFFDKDEKEIGGGYTSVTSAGSNVSALHVLSPDGTKGYTIGIYFHKDGTVGTTSPASNLDNSIVTTVSHTDYSVKLGNGLIINYGFLQTNKSKNITFDIPFSSANYAVSCVTSAGIENVTSTFEGAWTVHSKTTTGFSVTIANTYFLEWIAIGY